MNTNRVLWSFAIYSICYEAIIWGTFGYAVFVAGYSGWWMILAVAMSGAQLKMKHFKVDPDPVSDEVTDLLDKASVSLDGLTELVQKRDDEIRGLRQFIMDIHLELGGLTGAATDCRNAMILIGIVGGKIRDLKGEVQGLRPTPAEKKALLTMVQYCDRWTKEHIPEQETIGMSKEIELAKSFIQRVCLEPLGDVLSEPQEPETIPGSKASDLVGKWPTHGQIRGE